MQFIGVAIKGWIPCHGDTFHKLSKINSSQFFTWMELIKAYIDSSSNFSRSQRLITESVQKFLFLFYLRSAHRTSRRSSCRGDRLTEKEDRKGEEKPEVTSQKSPRASVVQCLGGEGEREVLNLDHVDLIVDVFSIDDRLKK